MSIHDFLGRIFRKRTAPVISTPWGNVTESARAQAAANMAANPELRDNVFNVVLKECGGDEERARKEFNRRYPEVPYS